MAKRKGNGDSDPMTLAADADEPAAPLAVPIGLTFVRLSAARQFMNTISISLADLAHVTIGANSGGANGYGLLSYQGRMFSCVGEFLGDGNPLHDPFIGFPIYTEV
jgi:hypothetical protein